MPSRRSLLAALFLLALQACGGGGGGAATTAADCSLPAQKQWLAGYMNDAYFWYASHPQPDPAAAVSDTIGQFFSAELYQGSLAEFPRADRWSFSQTTQSFDQFFSQGQSLGYGIAVAGLEVQGQPDRPLRVRYVEPNSPADGQVVRGETLVSLNGRSASQLIAANDFSLLTPAASGDALDLVVRNAAGAERSVRLVAAVFPLKPVSAATVLASPQGRKAGYLLLKDFISQALPALDAAFLQFKAAGVQELVLDLRYNGGGLISAAATLASYAVPPSAVGQPFAALTYNDRHQDSNTVHRFASQAAALGVSRVYVLTGQRTCSASELVVNGLAPFVQVVQVGDTTCGKPFGFAPVDHCGTTFSAVNFEARNANGIGRYWDGLVPACPVADDLDHALGDPAERLAATALANMDGVACPTGAVRESAASRTRLRSALGPGVEPGERRGMIDR